MLLHINFTYCFPFDIDFIINARALSRSSIREALKINNHIKRETSAQACTLLENELSFQDFVHGVHLQAVSKDLYNFLAQCTACKIVH